MELKVIHSKGEVKGEKSIRFGPQSAYQPTSSSQRDVFIFLGGDSQDGWQIQDMKMNPPDFTEVVQLMLGARDLVRSSASGLKSILQ